jgi:hypothetical protein
MCLQLLLQTLTSACKRHSACSIQWKGLLAQRWKCSHCQTLTDRQCSFWMLNQLKLLNKVLVHLSCNLCGSPTRHPVILPFIETGNFARKWSSSHFQTVSGRWSSFENFTLLTLLHKLLDPLASNLKNFLRRASELLPFPSKGWCCTKWYSCSMETLSGSKYSLKEVTQVSSEDKLLLPPACNIPTFLTTYEPLDPVTWKRWFCT